MKKMELALADLSVESFEIDARETKRPGTVRAHNHSHTPEECTWWGTPCGTTAAPGEMCGCIPQSDNTCATDWVCHCPPTPYG